MQKDVISRVIAVLSALIFMSVAFRVTITYFTEKKKKKQEDENMKNQFERELLLSQLETQEYSFNQISMELHDNIGQLLSTTKLLLGMAAMELQQPPDTLKTAEQTLAKAIVDLRLLSKSLNNGWFHHFSFIDHLEAEKERMNASKSIQGGLVSDYEKLPLEPGAQVILFRVVQQALQHIIKDGSASKINIQIKKHTSTCLAIKIDHNSHVNWGEEETETEELSIMRYRIQLLGGSIKWTSDSINNSMVFIRIPVKD